jgi:hypothetical protein
LTSFSLSIYIDLKPIRGKVKLNNIVESARYDFLGTKKN